MPTVSSTNFWQKNKRLILLLSAVSLLEILKYFPVVIETYYSNGVYPYIARLLRLLLGWIPFSIGDLFYFTAGVFILLKLIRFVQQWRRKQLNRKTLAGKGRKLLTVLSGCYLLFNLLWGLNYHRMGSAYQLAIDPDTYTQQELVQLTDTINARLTQLVPALRSSDTAAIWYNFDSLKTNCIASYKQAQVKYGFMHYTQPSIKKMLVGQLGGYGGYSGYLNPFTAEAHINAGMPAFARSYVLCHEMAHQLGYAAEEEANMIGYLAASNSSNTAIRYSVYHDMLLYAGRELRHIDSSAYNHLKEQLPPLVLQHTKQSREYYNSFQNPAQPLINWWYDKYLKANSQEKGLQSYSYVTAWLIAFARKYGWEKI